MAIACFIISLLVLLYATYEDTQKKQINPYPVYAAMVLGLLLHIFDLPFWGFVVRFALIALIFLFYKGFIGGGDAKLLMMITLLNGPVIALVTLALASLFVLITEYHNNKEEIKNLTIESIAALVQGTVSKMKGQGKQIALVPSMTLAFVITSIIGFIF